MISEKSIMIRTALPEVYKELVDEKKLFLRRHHLFTFGLVYGLLYDSRSDKRLSSDIVYLNQIKEQVTKDIIDIVHMLLDNGKKGEDEVFEDVLHIADGGVQKLKEIYEVSSEFGIPNIILEAEKIWPERATGLESISIK